MRYVCVHYLDDYVRAALGIVCQAPAANGVRVVKVWPDLVTGDTVVCEVEASTDEAFLCWITAVNDVCRAECCHEVTSLEDTCSCAQYRGQAVEGVLEGIEGNTPARA